MSTLDPAAARTFVRDEHAAVVTAIEECADAVADSWDEASKADGTQPADRLRACLVEHGVLEALPGVLEGTVVAAGGELPAAPVAAPPYVVVTSRGPILRATLDSGRLVVRFDVFRVTNAGRYERDSGDPTVVVEVR